MVREVENMTRDQEVENMTRLVTGEGNDEWLIIDKAGRGGAKGQYLR